MDPELVDADFEAYQQLTGQTQAQQEISNSCCPIGGPDDDPNRTPPRPLHEQVLTQLRQVSDPDIGRDIVALGFVRDIEVGQEENGGRDVKFCLRLTTPACPFKTKIEQEARAAVQRLPWVKEVDITIDFMADIRGATTGRPPNLRRVGFVVGIASCKGGSGKSTVALSLALMLRRSGAKVGLLDADIYGPSLPTLLSHEGAAVRFAEEGETDVEEEAIRPKQKSPFPMHRRRREETVRRARIEYEVPAPEETTSGCSVDARRAAVVQEIQLSMLPITVSGIKCMSYGFIKKENEQGYSALRGPFVSSVVEQLLTGTRWGALDYLLIDLPPGTGDIHITLTQQQVPLDGCVVVTTPQVLSLVDAEKGIRMLKSLSIPTLSVVCNMAYFVCDGCEKRHELYGDPTATQKLAELSSARQLVLLPFDVRLNSTTLAGSPLPDARDSLVDRLRPEDPVWHALRSLADRVTCELSTLRFGSLKLQPSLTADGSAVLVALLRPQGAGLGEGEVTEETYEHDFGAGVPVMIKEAFELPAEILRRRCSCVECIEMRSRGQKFRDADGAVQAVKLTETQEGMLALSWGDGHESHFALIDLLDICRQLRLAAADSEGGSTCHADPKLQW